jgi:hypothetical protein
MRFVPWCISSQGRFSIRAERRLLSRSDSFEFKDAGHWEVDGAVAADGRKYDLKLNWTF